VTIRRVLAVLFVCATAHTLALSQDYKKVIELAHRVEKRLNTMIAQEERARRAAENEARADLGKPPLPEIPAQTGTSGHETPSAPATKPAQAAGHETPVPPSRKPAKVSSQETHTTPASQVAHASGHETPAGKATKASPHGASPAPASKAGKAPRQETHAPSANLAEQAAGHEAQAAQATGHATHAATAAKDPLTRLEEGNRRFVEGRTAPRDFVHERPVLTGGQHPFVIVLTCSDSRVPPELLFDESLGQIFVVRDAGNVVDSVVLGSIEYAAEHLHVGLLVILGHEACGAVNATIKGGDVPPNIGSIVRRLTPPVAKVKAQDLKGVRVDSVCIQENVHYQVEQLTEQSDLLKSMVEEGHLRVVGGVYSLSTGEVTFFREPEPALRADHVPVVAPPATEGRKHGR
jgi:carbonic anhydrase